MKILFLAALCLLGFLLHIGLGSYLWISPFETVLEIFKGSGSGNELVNSIVWDIRLPRALGCVLGGALLGSVGAVFQTLFRNPLADPYVLGVSSGSALGGALAIILGLGGILHGLGVVVFAVIFGLSSLILVMCLARRSGVLLIHTLLLAGVVIGIFLSSLLTLAMYLSGNDLHLIFRWLMGSTTPMFWDRLAIMGIFLLIGGWILYRKSRHLNAFVISEEGAKNLGINADRLKWLVLVIGTAMTAVAVGSMGILGFIGLVAPHIARKLLGIDLRFSFIGALLVGSLLLLFADLIAQRIAPIELPVGVVTAIIGAPFLILLLRRQIIQ